MGGAIVRWVGGARIEERSLGAGTVMACLMVLVSAVSLRANYAAPKQDFAGALAYVESEAFPSDVIATAGVPAIDAYDRYFERSFVEVSDLAALEQLRTRGQTVWVLYTFARYLEASDPQLARALQDGCDESRMFWGTVGGGAVSVCRLSAGGTYQGGDQ